MNDKQDDEIQGEGNREADRRYREGVKETVDKLDLDEANDDRNESATND